MEDKIKEYIEKGITREAEAVFEQSKKEMIERLDNRKDEIVASICISLMSHVRLQDFGNELRITVATAKFK